VGLTRQDLQRANPFPIFFPFSRSPRLEGPAGGVNLREGV